MAAQRQLYSVAKRIFGWQIVISGPIAVGLAFSIIPFPYLKSYAALWGILVALADLVWLTPWQKRLRKNAALIQELFDCDVLSLPWQEVKAGKRPDPEMVFEQSKQYKLRASLMPPLEDWYDPAVGALPHHVAALVCQRSNCWWDSTQRRRYAIWVIAGVVVVFLAMLFFTMGNGFRVEDFVVKVAAPLAPALVLGIRQFREQMEAAERLDALKEHADLIWSDALSGMPEGQIKTRSRALQDEIFENRKRSPLVFDAIFKRLRRNYETQMNHGVAEYVAEAKQKLGST